MSILTSMYRGTTPTLCLSLMTSLDLAELSKIYVTFKMPTIDMTFSGDDVMVDPVEKKVYVSFSQEDTLSFGTGNAKVQARLLMNDGKAFATGIVEVPVEAILMEGVIQDDPDEGIGDGGDPDEGIGDGDAGTDVGE